MNNELNLNELFNVFKRKWKIITAISTLLALSALLISYKLPTAYEARLDLLVNYTLNSNEENTPLQSSDIELSLQLIETYKQILQSDRMQGNVISNLSENYNRAELREKVSIESNGNSHIITIVGIENSAEKAANLVNTYAKSFQEEIKNLLKLENIIILEEISSSSDVKELRMAPTLVVAIIFILSLFITLFIILVQEFYFTKLNTAEKVEVFLKTPFLGGIPTRKKEKRANKKSLLNRRKLALEEELMSMSIDEIEEFRKVRENIKYQMLKKHTQTIMLTSPTFGKSESLVSRNLAIVMAMDGKKTVYVDANLRESMGRKIFNLPKRAGLTSYIAGNFELNHIVQGTEYSNLSFISSGPTPLNPTEVLSSKKMQKLIGNLKSQYDVVIIDAPPLEVADAISLSTYVDGCLYVINAEETNGELAYKYLQHLLKVEAPILGTVLNKSY